MYRFAFGRSLARLFTRGRRSRRYGGRFGSGGRTRLGRKRQLRSRLGLSRGLSRRFRARSARRRSRTATSRRFLGGIARGGVGVGRRVVVFRRHVRSGRSGKGDARSGSGGSAGKPSTSRLKRDVKPANLFLKELGGAVVPQNEISPFNFLRQWQLLGNSLPGERA